jgi:hypothetical protein
MKRQQPRILMEEGIKIDLSAWQKRKGNGPAKARKV